MPPEPDPKYTAFLILFSKLRPFTPEIIQAHVEHLKGLDENGRLVVSGPFTDFDGGMVLLRAEDKDEAKKIAEADPFVAEGFESYELRTLLISCRENNYLL